MDFNKLKWYIFPFNFNDVSIFGADPTDVQREREDDQYISSMKAYIRLYRLTRKMGILKPKIDEKGWYAFYLDPTRFKAYTWNEIQPIALDILWKWFEDKDYKAESDYETKRRWRSPATGL